MNIKSEPLEELQHIKNIMERSSKFVSLSGLSGVAAGIWALAGAFIAKKIISSYYESYGSNGYTDPNFRTLKFNLLLLAAAVLFLAVVSAFLFTRQQAQKNKVPLWDRTTRRLAVNMLIPLVTGGLLILSELRYDAWQFAAPMALIFYGLALVNAGKYTLSEVRYLGICEIILGLISTFYIGYGLYFWAAGFGILHIIYGVYMWVKYEKGAGQTL